MIIWRGLGFLVAVIGFLSLLLTQHAVDSVSGIKDYYQTHGWPKLAALSIAGAMVWFLGRHLNNRPTSRTLIDKATGEELQIKPHHSFFFIGMEYWGPILVVLGIILFVSE